LCRHARQQTTRPVPLFPGYLFVLLSRAQRWRAINGTLGVVRLITVADQPVPVDDTVVKGLLESRNQDGFIPLPPRRNLARGDEIRVTSGSFVDAFGLFEEFSDRDRVTILLELLGRKVRVLLDAGSIEVAA